MKAQAGCPGEPRRYRRSREQAPRRPRPLLQPGAANKRHGNRAEPLEFLDSAEAAQLATVCVATNLDVHGGEIGRRSWIGRVAGHVQVEPATDSANVERDLAPVPLPWDTSFASRIMPAQVASTGMPLAIRACRSSNMPSSRSSLPCTVDSPPGSTIPSNCWFKSLAWRSSTHCAPSCSSLCSCSMKRPGRPERQ